MAWVVNWCGDHRRISRHCVICLLAPDAVDA